MRAPTREQIAHFVSKTLGSAECRAAPNLRNQLNICIAFYIQSTRHMKTGED
jgi:hypothetical protein